MGMLLRKICMSILRNMSVKLIEAGIALQRVRITVVRSLGCSCDDDAEAVVFGTAMLIASGNIDERLARK